MITCYLYWQTQDKKTLRRINALLQSALRQPYSGLGKPEPLRYRPGYWSRRIDEANRVVYKVDGDALVIAAVRGHYEEG